MNSEHKKLVMFDFDGVLVDTLLACYEINMEVNEDLSLEEYRSFFRGNIYQAMRKNGEPKKEHPNWIELYDTRNRELKIPDSIKMTLHALSKEYVLSIVSSTHSASIRQILKREKCEHFADILGADVHWSKSHKIKTLLEKYKASPQNAVFITDTAGDVREAAECQVPAIAVAWGFEYAETLENCSPIAVLKDPNELLGAVENVLK